jgi:uncharacterized protein GlcG (DUF336 family)
MASLSLAQAGTIVDEALAEGRRRSFSPLCVVVLDAGGHAVALKREDAASSGRPAIATAKAAGCLSMGFGGREIARRAQIVPTFFVALVISMGQRNTSASLSVGGGGDGWQSKSGSLEADDRWVRRRGLAPL